MKLAVTGGSGRIGSWAIDELLAHGYDVLNLDRKLPAQRKCKTMIVDLTNLGEVYGALHGIDAVIHLAGINAPGTLPSEKVFGDNVQAAYNILEASAGLGIRKAVCASSESIYGFCYALHRFSPRYLPIDESHPVHPQDCYGLSKVVTEEIAHTFHRRTGMQVICLRFGHVPLPDEYGFLAAHSGAERFLWSYVDVRDAAAACRLAVEAEGLGSVAMNICADDTCSTVPNEELLRTLYPDVAELRGEMTGYRAWSDNSRAKELLGWQPRQTWRNL